MYLKVAIVLCLINTCYLKPPSCSYLAALNSSLDASCRCPPVIAGSLKLDCSNSAPKLANIVHLNIAYEKSDSTRLKILDLAGNSLGSLEEAGEVFKDANLLDLVDLNLSECGITRLNSILLRGMRNLRYIYLKDNKLEEIPPELFAIAGLKLWELDLSFNFLKTLDHKIINDIGPSIRTLDLRNNSLISLTLPQDDPFPRVSSKTAISIDGNPWVCDCYLTSLQQFLRDKFAYEICPHTESPLTCTPLFHECSVTPSPWPGPNTSLTISCTISGFPLPEATWYHNESKIASRILHLANEDHTGISRSKTFVQFENTSWQSVGKYSCKISNRLNTLDRDIHISLSQTQEGPRYFMSSDDLPLIVGISTVISITVLIIFLVLCLLFVYKFTGKNNLVLGRMSSASSGMTVVNQVEPPGFWGPHTSMLGVNPLPKPPRRDLPGCFSRQSSISEQSTLPDTTALCLSRSSTEMTGFSGCSECPDSEICVGAPVPLDQEFTELLTSNEPGCRNSVRSIRVYDDPPMGMHAMEPPLTCSASSGTNNRPGYVTLPRRQRSTPAPMSPWNYQNWDSLGPRSSGDGSSNNTLNRSLDPNYATQTVSDLPPYPVNLEINFAINSVGLPPPSPRQSLCGAESLQSPEAGVERRTYSTLSSRHCLDTIQENE